MSTYAESVEDAENRPEQPVDVALRELEAAEGLPIEQRVTALENVHRLLSTALDFPSAGEAPLPAAPGA